MLKQSHFHNDDDLASSNVSSSKCFGVGKGQGGVTIGRFLNLNCGHNNQYSLEEKMQLVNILTESCDYSNSFA